MKIVCPVCKEKLVKENKRFFCCNNHSFDIAKEGYLNLNLKKSDNTGDNREMIRARTEFLNKGYYQFLRNRLNEIIDSYHPSSLLDLACGEGYYTSTFNVEEKIGVDLSKDGLKTASKTDKSTQYLLNSIFHNPIDDHSTDIILTCFAPIAKDEIVRILNENGRFILVKPNVNHLFELKEAVYDNPYLNEVEDIEIKGLKLEKEVAISSTAEVDHDDIVALFLMTPYSRTTSSSDKEKLNSIEKLSVTFDFLIDIYQKETED